jgi:hypothetical protein
MTIDQMIPVSAPVSAARVAIKQAAWVLFIVTSSLVMITASAANEDREEVARYQQERATCLNGHSSQDRATCLKEAGAALKEAKAGHLDNRQNAYAENALLRCKALPAEQREFCQRRMHGEGTTSGSVSDGGLSRELTVPVSK